MPLGRTLGVVALGAAMWWLGIGGSSESAQVVVYRSPQFGFRLDVPQDWVIHERASEALQALLDAAEAASSRPSAQLAEGLVVAFAEFPVGAAVPFNPNITVSLHQLRSDAGLPEDLLREAAARLVGGHVPEPTLAAKEETRSPVRWVWGDCRYEQAIGERRVPIQARLAIALDSETQRYVLLTASSLEELFSHYEGLFQQCLVSFRWERESS